ncbi:hypothetical protein GCM10020367_68020 [Streptomyces sannanensis]|uniref:PPM-type phosphatase domain-containing protein n=1 Tax=Streptomyces sannanensis TaxID=285536 RepID=A0ABP6S3F0_9ACTN
MALDPGAVLALSTDGLIESPGTGLDAAVCELADRLAELGDRPLESVADSLVQHGEQTHRRDDDMALMLLRPATG